MIVRNPPLPLPGGDIASIMRGITIYELVLSPPGRGRGGFRTTSATKFYITNRSDYMKPIFLVLSILLLQFSADAQKTAFTNPLLSSGADPWCMYKDGYYYYTNTVGNRIDIWKTKSIADLGTAEKKTIWKPPAKGPYSREIWAPEIHFLQGKWYVYFAADSGNNNQHRLWVIENASPDPLQGEWTVKGKLATPDDKWSIDGSVFQYKNSMYLIWSGWEGDVNGQQNIYIAKMKNPWSVEGNRALISSPTYDWEKNGNLNNANDPARVLVNEGPEVLEHNGRLFLVYSASGCWTDTYELGIVSFSGDDIMNPASWTKSPDPVFKQSPQNKVYAPGHNCFFKSPDGKEDWILYHANSQPGQGCGRFRSPRAQQFFWKQDGTPYFGEPLPDDVLIPIPSTEIRQAAAGKHTAANPVLNQDFPDPTVIRAADGKYYAYATQGGSNGMMSNIQLASSADLFNWKTAPDVLPEKPVWASKTQDFWAPHVLYDKQIKKYVLFYSAESDDTATGKCLGVAFADKPTGPFKDKGTPLICGEGFVNIDPMAVTDPATGKKLLYWGSGFQAIKVQEMTSDWKAFKPGTSPKDVVSPGKEKDYTNLIEGAWMDIYQGKYYLYYSGDNCCGDKAKYAVMVARADNAMGPFRRLGETNQSGSSVILEKDDRWLAPGHNSIIRDAKGKTWIAYHAIWRDKDMAGPATGPDHYVKRVLCVNPVVYTNGWPVVNKEY